MSKSFSTRTVLPKQFALGFCYSVTETTRIEQIKLHSIESTRHVVRSFRHLNNMTATTATYTHLPVAVMTVGYATNTFTQISEASLPRNAGCKVRETRKFKNRLGSIQTFKEG